MYLVLINHSSTVALNMTVQYALKLSTSNKYLPTCLAGIKCYWLASSIEICA